MQSLPPVPIYETFKNNICAYQNPECSTWNQSSCSTVKSTKPQNAVASYKSNNNVPRETIPSKEKTMLLTALYFIATAMWGLLSSRDPDWEIGKAIYLILFFIAIWYLGYNTIMGILSIVR